MTKVMDLEYIKHLINVGKLTCAICPARGVRESVFAGDIEVSKACYICGLVDGKMMGSDDELADAIARTNYEFF